MKQIFKLILLTLILSASLFAQTKTTIAVMELNAEGISDSEARIITSRLRTDLFNTNKFIVLEREKMDEILNEQGFQNSGCTTNDCAVEIGQLIGVKQMVAGEIGKLGNLFTMSIRLIDVETGKVLKTATEDCDCKIEQVLTTSVKNVAEILAGEKIQSGTYSTAQRQSNNINEAGITEWEMKGMSREDYVSFKRSGLSEKEWIKNSKSYNAEQRNAFVESIKSFLFAGWGQFSMDRDRGYFYLLTDAICISGFVITQTRSDDLPLIYFGFGIMNKIISSIDAGYTTPHYNEELKKKYKLSFTPKLNKYSNQPMLGLSVEF